MNWLRRLFGRRQDITCFYCPDPIVTGYGDLSGQDVYDAVLDHLESADHLIRAKQWKDTHDAH